MSVTAKVAKYRQTELAMLSQSRAQQSVVYQEPQSKAGRQEGNASVHCFCV